MDLQTAIVLNAVAIFAIAMLAFFFGGNGIKDRLFAAYMGAVGSVVISFWVWIGYVATHFIMKYW